MNLRSLTFGLVTCAIALAAAGCHGAPGKPGPDSEIRRPEQVTDFATLYGQNCAACHGVNGKGGAAIALNNPVYLTIAGVSNNIQRITANGVPNTMMPPFAKSKGGMLTDQQVAAIANGIDKNWGVPFKLFDTDPIYAASTPGNAANGQKAFATYCARCHGADGTGASASNSVVTGSLVDPAYLALISDQGLRSIILAGQTEEGPHDWRSYSTSHPVSDQEITDVVAWLASHRIATPGQPYKQRQ
jgi:mono/diheme cytochrome c family protein